VQAIPTLKDLSAQFPKTFDLINVEKNPALLLVIAYAMRRLPYVVRSAVAGLQQTPLDLELAARNLGAGPLLTARRIMIPLIAANLVAGALLAFAFAMLEVSDSLILAQKQAYWPITKAIYELFQRLGDGPYVASALGVWAMALLTLTILLANDLLGKRMGAIFRV
jgi:iron(III) transport system permease protein